MEIIFLNTLFLLLYFYICIIIKLLQILWPSCLWQVPNKHNAIYLTFDDGPHPTITPWVLQLLEQYQAKATFFVVGQNAEKYPQIMEQILQSGHTIGNHTHAHNKGWSTRNSKYYASIDLANTVVKSSLFRPPYGRIKSSQIAFLKTKFTIVMWSILSRDYNSNINIERTIKRICKNTQSGSIIVFHDSEKANAQLQKLLPAYLQFCQQNGFAMHAL